MRIKYLTIILLLIVQSCQETSYKIKLNALFSNGMVLQRDAEVNIWGEYGPNETLTISGSWGAETTADTDASGQWMATLSTPAAGGPHTLRIGRGKDQVTIEDVLMGEVWLASGQSNMEMPVKGWPPNDLIQNSEEEIRNGNYPEIRTLTVLRNTSSTPIDSISGNWITAAPETVGNFSATAYFFAKQLHKELKVPIGIIHSSWGGTVAEAWTSEPSLRRLGDFDEPLDGLKTFSMGDTDAWFGKFDAVDIPKEAADWKTISFGSAEASQAEFDDSDWEPVEIPGRYDLLPNGQLEGGFWLRTQFEVANANQPYQLKITAIDDMDATYINGQLVGEHAGPGHWNTERSYEIPIDLLKQGTNTLAIRAIDTGGPGSVTGPIQIHGEGGTVLDLSGSWKRKAVSEIFRGKFQVYGLGADMSERPEVFRIHQNIPSVLYNAMINPLVPYTIKGAIWYQGESNVGRADQDQKLCPAMIDDWRTQWGDDFSFYYVQIAPYNYNRDSEKLLSAKLRDAQRLSMSVPNSGMAVTLDIGNPVNIHPANKQDVGQRLALWALSQDYEMDVLPSGPLYESHQVEGTTLTVFFNYVGDGLVAADTGLSGFEVAGEDGEFVTADAHIVGESVEVTSSEVQNPRHVRYAWRDSSQASLFNAVGLPASSFSTTNN